MTLDSMHLVLYAIYAEYQKDLPDMDNVSAEALGIDEDVFNVAVLKLENEHFITGAIFKYIDQSAYPVCVLIDKVTLTEKGLAEIFLIKQPNN
ncbi:MAG: YjcQ family protein [Synergistaceae bacterium]